MFKILLPCKNSATCMGVDHSGIVPGNTDVRVQHSIGKLICAVQQGHIIFILPLYPLNTETERYSPFYWRLPYALLGEFQSIIYRHDLRIQLTPEPPLDFTFFLLTCHVTPKYLRSLITSCTENMKIVRSYIVTME